MKKNYESNVYIKFVPKDVEEEEFTKIVAKAGKILSLKLQDFVQKSKTGE